MFPILNQAKLASLAVAALLALAIGCGGDGGTTSTPPPAPPPFQPQSVPVTLGESGGTVTLMTTQAGGYTLNGQALASGATVTGEGDREYVLTLAGGAWSAAYKVPEHSVTLGMSGETVTITQAEDRTYMVGEAALGDGNTWTASNGNMYRISAGTSGMLQAEYVAPDPEDVALGQSDETIQLQRLESGQYTLDGQLFISGEVLALADGRRFRFTRTIDGMWMAEFMPPPPVTVQLGTTSMTVLLTMLETGGYAIAGQAIESGEVRAVNNRSYRFTQAAGGGWSAAFVSETVRVPLGSQGASIQITTLETGGFNYQGSTVSSGQSITVNGNQYRVTYGNGRWVGEFVPETITVSVSGTDITIPIVRQENGQYTHNGQPVETGDEIEVGESTYEISLDNGRWSASTVAGPILIVRAGTRGDIITLYRRADGGYQDGDGRTVRNGSTVRSEGGVRYVMILSNNEWSSRIYFPSTGGTGGTGGGTDGGTGGTGGTPVVVEALEDAIPKDFLDDVKSVTALANELVNLSNGKLLSADQEDAEDVSYSQYEGNGAVQSQTFVSAARKALEDLANKLRPLVEGSEAEKSVARLVISGSDWGNAQDALGMIFTDVDGDQLLSDPSASVERIDEEDALEDLDDLIEALSTESNFEDEFGSSGEFGRISEALRNLEDDADDIYNASKGAIALGATDNTRFGVVVDPAAEATAQSVGTGATAGVTVRPFAYSPLAEVGARSLPTRGTGRYTGRTFAADASGEVFDGGIELLVSFGTEKITAMITSLESTADNDPWRFDERDVEQIDLEANAIGDAGFISTPSDGAEVTLDGSRFTRDADHTFSGKFVGNSGEEVFGLWSITEDDSISISGSYGAEYRSTQRVDLPDADSTGLVVDYKHADGGQPENDTLTFGVGVPSDLKNEFTLRELYGTKTLSPPTFTDQNELKHTLRIRSRNTRYTRFGAWAYTSVDSSSDSPTPSVEVGWYGYSPLPATTTTRPTRVEAEYNGRTVAVDGHGTLYDGEYTLGVDWDGRGRIESEITNLRAVSGSSRPEFNNKDVTVIAFRHDEFENLSFSGPTETLVEYSNGTADEPPSQRHRGQFLGEPIGADGPFAVVGDWSVTVETEGTETTTLQGVFGADLDPNP